uniref:G_PROTEIN_RECEP_F1_2 domain-containing protein n=1 Tax=Steinernema glaseri TaxID=37863 RepID=A0A1I7YBX2_9BILA
MVTMVTFQNCILGLVTTIQFRYVIIAYGARLADVRPLWGYVYCIVIHGACSAFFTILMEFWRLPVADYPRPDLIDDTERIFCFHPDGITDDFIFYYAFVDAFLVCFFLTLFAVLCFRELKKQEKFMHKNTLASQRTLLRNLLISTVIPLLFGGIPLLVIFVNVHRHEQPNARLISSVCIVIFLNFGTAFGLCTLILFKPYREAVGRIFLRLMPCARALSFMKGKNETSVWAVRITGTLKSGT